MPVVVKPVGRSLCGRRASHCGHQKACAAIGVKSSSLGSISPESQAGNFSYTQSSMWRGVVIVWFYFLFLAGRTVFCEMYWGFLWALCSYNLCFLLEIQMDGKRIEEKICWGRVKRVKIHGCIFSVKSVFYGFWQECSSLQHNGALKDSHHCLVSLVLMSGN